MTVHLYPFLTSFNLVHSGWLCKCYLARCSLCIVHLLSFLTDCWTPAPGQKALLNFFARKLWFAYLQNYNVINDDDADDHNNNNNNQQGNLL